jgi:hypothetical protein
MGLPVNGFGCGRIRPALVLALPFLIGLSGAGLCQVPDTAEGSCRVIAAILVVYPALSVRLSEGPVRNPLDGSVRTGCRVHASGPASGMAGEVPPEEPIRFLLGESGWKEDARYSADGPGTTSFALRRHGILCRFSGGAHSRIEDGKILSSETYEFEAECADDGIPSPPPPQENRSP